MTVCAIRRHPPQPLEDDLALLGGPDMMEEVLRRADYLVIAMPETDETRGAISRGELGILAMAAGLLLAPLVRAPWQLYLSLGALVGGGVNRLAYTEPPRDFRRLLLLRGWRDGTAEIIGSLCIRGPRAGGGMVREQAGAPAWHWEAIGPIAPRRSAVRAQRWAQERRT